MLKKTVEFVTIESDFTDQRLDNFLMTRLKNVPKSRIYRIIRKGEIRVNKKRAQPSYRLQEKDVLRIPPMKMEDEKIKPRPSHSLLTLLSNRILYEDNVLLIMNKPSGIPVHGGTGVSMGVVEALRNLYSTVPHLELAHRLDLETSGCLILAKKRSALRELHALLREGKIHKIYAALTKGHWKENELRVDVPLLKNQLASGERIVKVNSEGKTALTVFEPVQSFKNAMLMDVILHTGRTHQIRVHAQYRKHPVAGDEKYGDREFNRSLREIGLKRLFLHAKCIEFTLPLSQQTIKVSAPLDEDLLDCLKQLEKNK